jgi:hypothetical protein
MLDLLFADRKLGAASKLAFLMLWRFAGEKPGRIVVTADWLAGCCGRSPRAAWDWLAELEGHDLVKLGERNERRGSVVVDVYNPCPGDRAAITDPQERLPLEADHPKPIEPKPEPAAVSGVFVREPPRPLVPKNTRNISNQGTNVFKESKPKETKGAMGQALAAVLATLEEATDPASQKQRLKRRIVAACGGKCADWVAGSASNLVLYSGVPVQELDGILRDVAAMRETGSLRDAGAFFHSKARQLAARHGATWPRQGAGV